MWNPDLPTDQDFRAQWDEVPDNEEFGNGFRAQWEQYLRDVAAGRPHPYDFMSAVRGLELVEAGLTVLRARADGSPIESRTS